MDAEERLAAIAVSAQEIMDLAKSEGRSPSEDETKQLEKLADEARGLKAALDRRRKSAAIMKQFEGFSGDDLDGEAGALTGEDVGGMVAAIRSKSSFATSLRMPAATRVKAPAPVGSPALTGAFTAAGGVIYDDVYAVPEPYAGMPLRDLFEIRTSAPPYVRFYRMGSARAGLVAEGGLKPDAGLTVEPVELALQKIAATYKFSDELSKDAPALLNYMQQVVLRGLLAAENEFIVTTMEEAPGAFTATGAAADAIDVVASAIGVQQSTNGVTPKVLLANPTDWAALRTLKSSTAGEYRFDPLVAGPPTLHGVPVVMSPAVAPGRLYLVGDGAALFYDREGVRVEMSGSSEDDFVHNLYTVRVEERVLPAMIQPSLITKVTLTPPA